MEHLNCKFDYNDCTVSVRFTPADKYGVDRHTITVYKSMCKPLSAQCFKKTEPEIMQFAREMTAFQTCTCG